jgi:hypothetical protein
MNFQHVLLNDRWASENEIEKSPTKFGQTILNAIQLSSAEQCNYIHFHLSIIQVM